MFSSRKRDNYLLRLQLKNIHVQYIHVCTEFAVVSTHQSALGPRGGLWPVLLCVIYKEGSYVIQQWGHLYRLVMCVLH
jgi:hypothetical protein